MNARKVVSIANREPPPLADSGRLLYRTPEAAAVLGISDRKLRELIAAGRLPCVHIDAAVRVRRSDLLKFVESL
jgi:excisionase family DNA binding protein